MTYWISLRWATFALVAKDGRIIEAAPIARWTTGKDCAWVLDYFRGRGAKIVELRGA